ncbi:MAG TPA: DNA cytosine methyltransferase [Longimicrobium sp.]|nr:DNA cytosine methyltransferase [Longimicrobium sp.]
MVNQLTLEPVLPRRRTQAVAVHRTALSSIDLFAGAGGLSLGLHEAGFEVQAAVEIDTDACQTFASSFPLANVIDRTLEGFSLRKFEGVDLVAGGPPCQPFSSGGKRLAARDGRNMIPEFVRVVADVRPRAFLMENVFGLSTGSRREYLESIINQLAGLGYTVTSKVVNAAAYGIPQKRRRVFLVGLKRGRFEFPPETHGPGTPSPYVGVSRYLDLQQVLGEPNPSKIVYAKKPDLRPSPFDGQLFNGGGRPIDPTAPCHTILASAGGNKTHLVDTLGIVPAYHSELLRGGQPRSGEVPGARRLTVAESAIIQTFPAGMAFTGSRSSQYTQIGNAVPPKLAAVVGSALARQLMAGEA